MLAAAGEATEAETAFRQAARMAGQVPLTWVLLAQHLARTGHKDQIDEVIEQAQGQLPPSERALALASCYESAGRLDRAEEYYRAALSARPSDVWALVGMANVHLRQGQWAQAEPLLRRVLTPPNQAGPATIWARRALAVALVSQPNPPRIRQARALLEENRKAGPPTGEDLVAQAVVLTAEGTRRARREARGLLEVARKKRPLLPADLFLLARLYDAEGDWPRARQVMEEALAAGADGLLRVCAPPARAGRSRGSARWARPAGTVGSRRVPNEGVARIGAQGPRQKCRGRRLAGSLCHAAGRPGGVPVPGRRGAREVGPDRRRRVAVAPLR